MKYFLRRLNVFAEDLWKSLKDPETTILLFLVASIIIVGTAFYNRVEGWGLIDSFYFTIITITTVGYGDFAPKTEIGKLFTTAYILIGLGMLLALVNVVIKKALEEHHVKNNFYYQELTKELKKKK